LAVTAVGGASGVIARHEVMTRCPSGGPAASLREFRSDPALCGKEGFGVVSLNRFHATGRDLSPGSPYAS